MSASDIDADLARFRGALTGRLNHVREPSDDQRTDDLQLLADLIGGRGATFTKNTADPGERTFEVRRDGKHVGFIDVTDSGGVVWVA